MPGTEVAACRAGTAPPELRWARARRRRHDHHTRDPLVLPGLLVVAPVTVRFAFARDRVAHGGWEPAYRLSSGYLWWRCLRFAASRGELHPCAERLAKHLSWHLGDQVSLTDIRTVLGGYAAYHHLSARTAWTDWGRLVAAGWLAPTRAPANQGRGHPQGPGSGRVARYVLTAPTQVIAQLRARSRRRRATSLDSFSPKEAFPSPSVPPQRQDQQRGWNTSRSLTPTQRRDASALLAGCHPGWRRQRPETGLLRRTEWDALLPLLVRAQQARPEVNLAELLGGQMRSARSLAAVCAWRLHRLLTETSPGPTPPAPTRTLPPPAPAADRATQARYAAQARAAIAAATRTPHSHPHR